MYELSISKNYPSTKFNLLGNTDVMVKVPDIKTPVIQAVQLDPTEGHGDVYVQTKGYRDRNGYDHPTLYAITKNGLKKLADGAGIKMVSSEHVIPNTCRKCVAVNQHSGKVINCGNCSNKDIAFHVTIAVPQLTGETIYVEDTHEIIVETVTDSMSEKQKAEFMKHLPQICEAKALNGAIRTALHIKGTYTLDELKKPFVVAYLVPNLDNADVKRAAIDNMFDSSSRLFGRRPPLNLDQIETKVPEIATIEASDGENYDQYIDETYKAEVIDAVPEEVPAIEDTQIIKPACADCGCEITERIYAYSKERLGRPLCYDCQDAEKKKRGWRR